MSVCACMYTWEFLYACMSCMVQSHSPISSWLTRSWMCEVEKKKFGWNDRMLSEHQILVKGKVFSLFFSLSLSILLGLLFLQVFQPLSFHARKHHVVYKRPHWPTLNLREEGAFSTRRPLPAIIHRWRTTVRIKRRTNEALCSSLAKQFSADQYTNTYKSTICMYRTRDRSLASHIRSNTSFSLPLSPSSIVLLLQLFFFYPRANGRKTS